MKHDNTQVSSTKGRALLDLKKNVMVLSSFTYVRKLEDVPLSMEFCICEVIRDQFNLYHCG
jgi:hypothetical protein